MRDIENNWKPRGSRIDRDEIFPSKLSTTLEKRSHAKRKEQNKKGKQFKLIRVP